MRVVALIVLTLVAALVPPANASDPNPPALVASYHTSSGEEFLAWTPVPGAWSYTIYRGPTPNEMVAIGETANVFYHDDTPTVGEVYYGVSSVYNDGESHTNSFGEGPRRGDCVQSRGNHFAITFSNCGVH